MPAARPSDFASTSRQVAGNEIVPARRINDENSVAVRTFAAAYRAVLVTPRIGRWQTNSPHCRQTLRPLALGKPRIP
jgi:hypothetical protein